MKEKTLKVLFTHGKHHLLLVYLGILIKREMVFFGAPIKVKDILLIGGREVQLTDYYKKLSSFLLKSRKFNNKKKIPLH